MSTQSVPFHHLPARSISAAANMAVDTLLLEQYPQPDAPRFRHYGWASPAFTFGRTQQWEHARQQLPVHVSWQDAHERFATTFELVRRPTGGGVVDHRADWTYALVIPASHPLFRATASDVYRDCHQVLVNALAEQGVAAQLMPCAQACASDHGHVSASTDDQGQASADAVAHDHASSGTSDHGQGEGVCFTRAEPYDVVAAAGVKLAGAAQRRSKDGLLVQGSVLRQQVGDINWQRFEQDVAEGFARYLAQTDGLPQSPPQPASVLVKEVPFPKWDSALLQAKIDHFAAPQWNCRR